MTDVEKLTEAMKDLVSAGAIISQMLKVLEERITKLEKTVRNLKDPHYHPEYTI